MSPITCGHCGLESPVGMKFCGACGRPLATADPDEGAQRRYMTVMFCDMVGSTKLVDALDPEDFREILAAYQDLCEHAVGRYEGWAAQWAGDGLLAYFGYPDAHEDHAQRAVHAALEIVHDLEGLSSRLEVPLYVRVGLHSGIVVAGEVGTGGARLERAIIGSTPHVAARLQALAEPSTIVVSDAVRELTEGFFEFEPLGHHELRGVARPVSAHRVLHATGAISRIEFVGARKLTPMVGRDAELDRLIEAWEGARAGRGAIVHVPGEAGIGKSRLVRTLTEHVGGAHVWQCSAHHRATSLYPVVQHLGRRLGVDRAEAPAAQLEEMRRSLEDVGLDADEHLPLLTVLLAIEGGEQTDLGAIDARTATLRTIETLLLADAAQEPVLLVVEDLHWADPTTVELLDRLVGTLAGHAVLCVATYRGEFEPPWAAAGTIALERLSDEDVRAMVAASGLDADLSGADGVPLFVEEMLKMLALGNRSESGTYVVVPPTLHGLLTQRLEQLPQYSHVIDVAAALGREFDQQLLAALVPLEGALAPLTAQDVIRPVETAPGRLEFSHALLQEAAYSRMLRRRRRSLHAQVAATITTRFPGLADREPEIVAQHWVRAGESNKSVPFWHAAGRRAIARAAFVEAADHFQNGIDAAGPIAINRAELLIHVGACRQAGIGYAATGVDDAYAEARRLGVRDRLPFVLRGQWIFHMVCAEYDRASEFADEQLQLGEQRGDPELLTDGHYGRGMVHLYRGEFEQARTHLSEAYDRHFTPHTASDGLSDAEGDSGVAALAYNSNVLWNLGEVEESLRRSELSLELAERLGGPVTRAQAWGMRALLHVARLEPAEYARWTERTRAHSIDHNVGYWRALSALLHGALQARAGNLATGCALVDTTLEAYVGAGSRLGLSRFLVLQADLRLLAANYTGAAEALRRAEAHMQATGERYTESELNRVKGRLLMAGPKADPAAATAAFAHAVTAAREQGARMLELRAATTLIQHEQAIGVPATALDRLEQLYERFSPELELVDLKQARALLGERVGAR